MRKKKNNITSALLKFWNSITSLPFGRQLVFFASILSLLFLFLPWFESESAKSLNAFEKAPIFGFLLLIFSVTSLMITLREIFSFRGFLGEFSHGTILLFLFAQGMYTVVIATFILYGMASGELHGEVRFGLMLTFLAFGIGGVGSIFSKDFIPKGEDKKIFIDPNEVDLSKVNLKPETQLSLGEEE